jgi:glycosyltransferase involved in cell wall biosynthesis
MQPETPLVSIVTPSYNMVKYLPETIESVLSQDYPRIEYIVADGGSTDGSLEVLEKYKGRLSFSSAPDAGPSDAIFKGLRKAQGDILGWINADDSLLPGGVRKAVEFLVSHPEVDVVYGEGWWIGEDGRTIGRYPSLPFEPEVLARDCFICQPAAFIRAAAYRRCELDPQVNWSFDYDLWIRMVKAGMRFAFLPEYLANSRIHSGAKTIYERGKVFEFSMDLLKRHYQYVPLSWILGYTAFRIDRRDQFFQPLQVSVGKYLASLPVGIWYNRQQPFRYLGEWISAPFRAGWRRLANTGKSGTAEP